MTFALHLQQAASNISSGSGTPPPSGSLTTYFGATPEGTNGEDRASAYTRIDTAYGGLDVVRYWRSSDASPYTWPLDPTLGGDKPVVISTSGVMPADVLAGTYDAGYQAMFANMPTDRPIWWCYYHEPEDQINSGTFTVTQWQQATNYVGAIARQYAPANAKHVLIMMGDTFFTSGGWTGQDWHWYLDGIDSSIYDVLGGDVYPFDTDTDPHSTSGTSQLHTLVTTAATLGKTWGMPEFGVSPNWDDTQRASYLTGAIDVIDTDGNCEFACYYESWRGSRGPWNLIDVSPQAEAVWAAACERMS